MIDNFAEWAFGPSGFPQLLVLAFGDFSYGRLHRQRNVLYGRNDPMGKEGTGSHHRTLTPADKELWGLVVANLDTLSACPDLAILHQAGYYTSTL